MMEKRSCKKTIFDLRINGSTKRIFRNLLHLQISENGVQKIRYSGTFLPSTPYISTGNSVSLTFQSDGSKTYSGFQLNYQSKFGVLNKRVFNHKNIFC